MTTQFGQLLTPQQAAEMLSVCTKTIYNLTAKGLLPCIKVTGKIVRYDRNAVERALSKLAIG